MRAQTSLTLFLSPRPAPCARLCAPRRALAAQIYEPFNMLGLWVGFGGSVWYSWIEFKEKRERELKASEAKAALDSNKAALAAAGAAALTATTTQQEAEALAKQYSPGAVGAALAWYCEKRAAAAAAVDAYAAPPTDRLLPDLPPHARHVRTLVLDLDDLLIHSHWTRGRGWRTFKRPGVDDFLRGAAQYYEVVVYTAQLPTYADPILDR